MEQADIILSGGTVITINDDMAVLFDSSVVIKGNQIIALGARDEIEAAYGASDVIDCSGHYIMPGLVNAHTHAPMTLLRGLADDLRLDVWLMGYMMPVEREFVSPEFCRLGTRLACAEMLRGGVTSFVDMYYYESDIADVTAEIGMRALLGETVLKFPAPDAPTYEDSLKYTRQFIEQWRDHPLVTPTVAPHAPYSNTEETLQLCADLAHEFDVPPMIHIAETKREVDDSMEQYSKTVVSWVKQFGILDQKAIAAHCVHIDEYEMQMLAKRGVTAVHCPSANLKLASGIANVTQMLEQGVNVALGTDGPASNNDLDMFEEMRLAALLAKVTPPDPTALPARQALQMATRNGAKALGMADQIGSLEVGKLADVIVVDARPLHNFPHFDFSKDNVFSRVVYASNSSDVRHTLVNGRVLMRDRVLQTVDEDEVRTQADAYAEKVREFMLVREKKPLNKLVHVAVDVERSESFEIQVKAKLQDASIIEDLLSHEAVEVMRSVHYRQYDTYFMFDGDDAERVRYREDYKLDAKGEVSGVRSRLTYTSGEKERSFHDAVLLSHSRLIAPASHPLRFYQEYFQASRTKSLRKERRRWRILYKGVLFFVNIDTFIEPAHEGIYVELKSRTWSLSDAEVKANYIHEMMQLLGLGSSDVIEEDYHQIVASSRM